MPFSGSIGHNWEKNALAPAMTQPPENQQPAPTPPVPRPSAERRFVQRSLQGIARWSPFALKAVITLITVAIWGCNAPSMPTPIGTTLLNSKPTHFIDKETHQNLSKARTQKYEKHVFICPKGLAEIKVMIGSAQSEKTQSLYLTDVTMMVTQNGDFEIEATDQGKPINRGTESVAVMAVPYLVTCSKVSRFRQFLGQSLIEVYADGRIQVK